MRRPQAGAPPARSAEARRGGGKRGRGDKCDISLRTFGPYFEILFGVGDSHVVSHARNDAIRHGKRERMREYNTFASPKPTQSSEEQYPSASSATQGVRHSHRTRATQTEAHGYL